MPLLGRQPFERTKVKFNAQQQEKEFFYCKHTQEIFLDYESLFQRVIQCNSLIWTCSVTARPGLTFQEAVESERKARNTLATFPEPLKQPVLYIATLTKRNRIGDLCEDVYNFVRNRYFVGEKVDFIAGGERKSCEVTAVCATPNGKPSKSPKKNGPSHTKEVNDDPDKQKYELFETDDTEEIQMCHIVEGKDIMRQKGSFNKTTNKLFIKQHVTLKGGTLVVKDSSVEKYELDSPSLKKITGHQVPNFTTLKGSPSGKLKNGQMEITKAFTQKSANKSKERIMLSPEEAQRRFEEHRKKKMMEKEKEKEQMREEKLLIARFKMEWNKPRDDLECDDLKDLPTPVKVKCNIPEEVFGDALAILEFVRRYSTLLKAKRIYPNGLVFETLEKALENTDIDGPFNDLLQLLLLAILKQQEEEGEEQVGIKDLSKKIHTSDELMDDEEDVSATKAILSAKVAATWPQYYHGTILRMMPLDSFTLTEMLRLHLLASGSEVFPRFYERGMYVSQENPGLYFKIEHPEIIKLLTTSSVFQLNAVQRVKVLNVLMEQLLTYESYREHIENSAKKLKDAQYALKQVRWARMRRSKEEKTKKKPDDNKIKPDDKIKEENESNVDENTPEVELTPEQKALEVAEFLESSLKKEKELLTQIEKLNSVSALHPVGLDRAYRRYWVFKSVGGIFVEENDPFIGVCQPRPTPSQPTLAKNQDELPLSFMRKYLNTHKREDKNGQSDKENDSGDVSGPVTSSHNHSKAQKLLSDANPRINSPLKVKRHSSSTSSEGADDKDLLKKDFVCTADPISCPVHGTNKSKPRIPWSVFYSEEDVDNLIASLNPRGFREGKLRKFLQMEKINLVSNISACPVNKLTGELLLEAEPLPEVRKSNRLKSVFYNIQPDEALLSTFRDAILENEEKLWSGSLGIIKVQDRKAWRQAIFDGDYDMQVECLKWSNNGKRLQGSSMEAMICGTYDDDKMSQRSSSPSLVASPFIVDLASALLQVAQGVEQRYLISPLVDDEKYKKQKQKLLEKHEKTKKADSSNQDDEVMDISGKGSIKSPMQRWEESLMHSTSLSQLFIHLATLERSISWNKAAKHASCRICRKRGDPENMLLCDDCDKGFHMYCLKPPLTSIPTGDWFCPPCEPLPPKESRSAVKSYKEISDSEGDEENVDEDEEEEVEGEEEDEGEEEEEEEEVEEDNEGKVEVEGEDEDENEEEDEDGAEVENEEESSEEEVYDDEEEAVDASGDETDFCLKCKKGGDLICCDVCPASFHLGCVDPPLKRVPRGNWSCPVCSGTEDVPNKKTSKPIKSSKSPEQESTSGNRSSRRHSNDTNGLPLDYNNCSKLLTLLSQHKDSWPFLKAVTKKEAPDYHKIIKRPIDLGVIRSRLNNQTYLNNSQFVADVYLMFQNCEVYNASESQQYTSGKRLARYFQSLLRQYKLEDSNKRARESDALQLPAKRSRN